MISQKLTSIRPTQSVDDAKSIVDTLQYVCKTRALYSEEHTKYQKAVTRLKNSFDTYFKKHNELCIHVKKDRLLHGDEVLYEGTAKDGDIAFALFRDGMIKIVFQPGIDLHETQTFVTILHKFEVIPAEAEGDIVTALWEAQLPHVHYEAVDNIIDTDSDGEGTSEKGEKEGQGGTSRQSGNALFQSLETLNNGDSSHAVVQQPEKLRLVDTSLIELNPIEVKALKEMVWKEEQRDATGEILNMMADILKGQEGLEFLDVALEYMKEGLQKALSVKDFNSGYRILKRLHQVRKFSQKSSQPIHPGIKEFFAEVSDKDYLAALQNPWPHLNESERLKAKQTLIMLPSKAIIALGPLLSDKLTPEAGELITDVIVALAERNVRPLEQLLITVNKDLLYRLIPLLGRIRGKEFQKILIKLVDHPEERVRIEILNVIVQQNLWIPEKLIALVNDENANIRQKCLDYLGSRRCEKTQKLLLDYLKKRKFKSKERDYQSACYRALGKCGTGELLPYLQDSLLNGGLISKFLATSRRMGAAIALMELKTEEAKQVLVTASQCRYPGIKKVALAVL